MEETLAGTPDVSTAAAHAEEDPRCALHAEEQPDGRGFVTQEEEYERRRQEVEDDEEGLWELYVWCNENDLEKQGRSCLRRILKLSPNHKRANEALGHILYDGKWFTSEKKLEEYKKAEELRRAEEEGLVRWKDEWVPKEDLPFLEQGLTKDLHGNWVDAETERRLAEGWVKQDLNWVSPEETSKLAEGLWKVDDRWLSLEEANKVHAEIGAWWQIPTEHFLLRTTCDRSVAEEAIKEIERAYKDLARAFGRAPTGLVPVYLMRSAEQYGSIASGVDRVRPPVESHGLSSVHWSFFADIMIEPSPEGPEWSPAGVGYWDAAAPNGASFGRHSARRAAAESFAEALDPSSKTIARFVKDGRKGIDDRLLKGFYDEKQIPRWFRDAVVGYVERYFVDSLVGAGGDPHWALKWSVQNILNKGGFDGVKTVISATPRSDDPERAAKLLNERGLLLAFVLDGKNADLTAAHGAVKSALSSGEGLEPAFSALAGALEKSEAELRRFAQL